MYTVAHFANIGILPNSVGLFAPTCVLYCTFYICYWYKTTVPRFQNKLVTHLCAWVPHHLQTFFNHTSPLKIWSKYSWLCLIRHLLNLALCLIRRISMDTLHWLPMLKGTLYSAVSLICTKDCILMGRIKRSLL